MHIIAKIIITVCSFLCVYVYTHAQPSPITRELPEFSEGGETLFSTKYKKRLGQTWLKNFLAQAKTTDDPLLYDYLDFLIHQLAKHSPLTDKELSIVVVDNPTINAFAVPGGVIGVHTGLLVYAKNEDQLSAVLAHELAHLSQDHFARLVAQQKRDTLPNILGLLTGIALLGAGSDSQAGIATIAATQAGLLQRRLRYSRNYEKEADRIAIAILANAGRDPNQVAAMFEQMQQAYRYQARPPEFLLTHPITQRRIADSQNRAGRYTVKQENRNDYRQSEKYYQLMRVQAKISLSQDIAKLKDSFKAQVHDNGIDYFQRAYRYGLAVAMNELNETTNARHIMAKELAQDPSSIPHVIAMATIENSNRNPQAALSLLKKHISLNPDNHPLVIAYAKASMSMGNAGDAIKVLVRHVRKYGHQPNVWRLLADAYSMVGNVLGSHQTQAEYYMLYGQFGVARKQLRYALQYARDNRLARLQIESQLKYIEHLEEEYQLLQ